MVSSDTNGLGDRIIALETDLIKKSVLDIAVKLSEILANKRNSDDLNWLVDRIRYAQEEVDRLDRIQEQLVAGEIRPVLFDVMERFSRYEERAGCRIVSEDLQKIGEDLKERLVYYRRAVEYGKIAHELMDLIAAQ